MKKCSVCGETYERVGHFDVWNCNRNESERQCNKLQCKKHAVVTKKCSVCGESLPKEGHYNDRNWKANNAERKCNKPTRKKPQAKKGIWRCIACGKNADKEHFSQWMAKHVKNNGTARCDACMDDAEEQQRSQRKRTYSQVQKQ